MGHGSCNVGGKDTEGQRKQRLLTIFGDWTDMVTDLIRWVTHCQRHYSIWKRLDRFTHIQCQLYTFKWRGVVFNQVYSIPS